MRVFAARYFMDSSERDYEIVVYKEEAEAEEAPHDYWLSFTKKEWRKMGCRVPKKHEVLIVKLCAAEDRPGFEAFKGAF